MVVAHSLALAVCLGYTLYHQSAYQYLLVTLSISFVYYGQRNINEKEQSIAKLLKGEFPTQLLFMAWLYFFKVPYFLHYIPLILSNAGKLYWLLNEKNVQITTVIQQLILFQSQCQAFISFTLFFSALTLNPAKILQFLTYVLILKIKYRFYAPAHKAYNEVHFFFDRISKYFKFRSFYHFIYRAISCFSNDLNSPSLTWQILY